MNPARKVREGGLERGSELQLAMGDWVDGLAPWEVMVCLTFRFEASVWSAQRLYERFMRSPHDWGKPATVSHFYALEQNPSRDGFHVHALWVDAGHIVSKLPRRDWATRYGWAHLTPVKNKDDVSDYVAKYVTKEGSWWDVRMVGQRQMRFSK